jgi:aspartyl-tRNA(Asn)/glutamyl-tRNA(Gln) amidotransferase subunit B
MNTYYTTIGLEIHAELKTKTKMFSSAKNDPDEENPNVNIDPVSLAHPGTLPTINKQAIEHVIKVGLALNGNIANFTEFDRKNYFYPDIPKGYQISQYKYPIVSGGHLAGVDITRVHLEEDTGTSKHDRGDFSLVDYNRAGVPLMELVTEPCIHTPEDAGKFGRELQTLLQYLKVSDANMEKGEMRVELNISISPSKEKFGTKVEVKNINSFRAVERAAKYEIARMTDLYEAGRENEIVQETRGWDETKQSTFSQRSKENSEDYRYFPDPDLPKMYLHEMFDLNKIKESLPELPEQKRSRFTNDFGIKAEDIEVYINDKTLSDYFEGVVSKIGSNKEAYKTVSNLITSDFIGLKKGNEEVRLPSLENFAELASLFTEGKISSRAAKDILGMIVLSDESPVSIAEKNGMFQSNDTGPIEEIAKKLIEENPSVVEDYKNGKENALMFFVGRIMKESKGSANPSIVKEVLIKLLS